jgi:ribosomal protein S27E
MASVIYRCPTKAVNVQVWFDEPTNDRETYISIRCPACARVHLVNPVTGKTPADG